MLLTIVDIQNAAPVINCYGLKYYKILLSTGCSDLSKLDIDNLSKPVIQNRVIFFKIVFWVRTSLRTCSLRTNLSDLSEHEFSVVVAKKS